MTRIDLIRHGEPQGGSKYRGHSIDDALTDTGWQQMWDAIGDANDWNRIFSSPLIRCSAFAHALSGKTGIDYEIVDALKEIGFGSWTGKTKVELKQEIPKEFTAFYDSPYNTPEGAEFIGDFYKRISLAIESILENHHGEKLLIVAHAGVIRAVLIHALSIPVESMYNFEIKNGLVSRIAYGRNVRIEFINARLG